MNAILSQVNRILVIFAIHSHLCWISRGNLRIWLIVRSTINRLMPTIWANIVVILLPPLVAPSNLASTMDFVCNRHFVAESRLRHSTSVTCRDIMDMGHFPLPQEQTTPVSESTHCLGKRSDCVDDKYLLCNFNEQAFTQKQYFCSLQLECKGVKVRILFWRLRLDAYYFVLNSIEKGYVISFIDHHAFYVQGQ